MGLVTSPVTGMQGRKWLWGLVTLAVVLAMTGFYVYQSMHKLVAISIDNGQAIHAETFAATVKDVLKEKKVELAKHDVVKPGLNTNLEDNMQIRITRANEITVVADGQTKTIASVPKTVKDILAELEIAVNPQDKVTPALATVMKSNDQISIVRVTEKLQTEDYKISFQKEKRRDSSVYRGVKKVLQKGESGLGQKVFKVTYEDGKVVKRELVEKKVVRKPQNQIIALGSKERVKTVSRGGKEVSYKRSLVMHASGYTHTGNSTSTGATPRRGIAAVDPSVIPLGTKLYVEGYGYAVAADVGSAIKGSKIDLFFDSYAQAMRWGRKNVKVYVLTN